MDGSRGVMLRHLMAGRLEDMLREMPTLPQGHGESDLLDFGCGFGHFLHLAHPHFRTVQGLELSKTQADFGRQQWNLDISSVDALKAGWDGQHHVITAWEVLEHLPDPTAFLRFCFDHLKPGGQLILSTPNWSSLFRHLLGSKWFYAIPSQHLTYFDKTTLEGLLKKVGFGECRFRTSGRSLLRERWNSHNPNPRTRDERAAWIENLRVREKVEELREKMEEPGQSSTLTKVWNRLIWHAWNPWVTSGFGDQLRVYAIKP
jgi:SAM-dependent methyltransferase